MRKVSLYEDFINEKREDVGKYNTVKKVIAKLGKRPSEQELASFINDNYYDVTEVERGDDDPQANDKIADLVGFYKFDIDDWEIAWADAQNESVVTEGKIKYSKGKTYQSDGHWTVYVDSNSSGFDIRVNHSAGWRLDPQDVREETIQLLDNGRQRATLNFKSGNIDKLAQQMFDLNDRTSNGNQTKLTAKDYADIIRVWIDMKMANESVITEEDGRDTLAELNDMTLGQLERIEDYAEMISDRMEAGQQLESWMFSQITGAVDNLNAVHDAMDGTDGIEEASAIEEDENPCWDGYKVGDPKTKVSTRTGKRVNNCVPKNESTLIAEAIDPRSFTIFQIATPAPREMLVAELRDLFNEKTVNTQFNDNEGYESVIMFNLSKSDIKKIEANIGDVLVWEYLIGKGKSII